MQNQFRFSLLGSYIEIRSDSSATYMEQVFRHLERKISLTQDTLKLNDALKTAVITAFLLVDELLVEREERAKLLPDQESLEAEQLIQNLLQELQDLPLLDK